MDQTPSNHPVTPASDASPPSSASRAASPVDHEPSLLAGLEASLRRARKVARLFLIIQRIALIVSVAIVGGLCVGVLDFLVRTPWMMRAVLLVVGVCTSCWVFVKFVLPAVRFRPSLTEIALRLEATDTDGRLGLKGNLASGLELARTPHLIGVGKELAVRLVETLIERTRSLRVLAQLITPKLTIQRVSLAVLTLMPMLVLCIRAPLFASIGAQRVLTPWRNVQWPKRYAVSDATIGAVHPTTAALPLRAVLQRSPNQAGKSDVFVEYRASGGTGENAWTGSWERVLLTGQGNVSDDISAVLGGVRGELYERLLEPAAIDPRLALLTDEVVTLEYRINAGDDQTETQTLLLAKPPTIATAKIAVTPPPYAKDVEGFPFVMGEKELTTSDGSRGSVGPVLAGSAIELTLGFSKPMPAPKAGDVKGTLPGIGENSGLTIEASERTWVLRWTAIQPLKFTVNALDEHALALSDDATFRIDTTDDAAPTAAILLPASDESVLPSAVVAIKAEARDDVALSAAGVEHQRMSPVKGSESRVPAPTGEAQVFAPMKFPISTRQGTAETALELSPLELKAGDELWLTATGQDAFSFEGMTHATTRSAARKLRVITDSEFIEQIRSELSTIRQSAMRIDSDQAQTRAKTQEARLQQDAADSQRRQDAISDRLKPPAEALKRLQDRFERNNATDQTMSSTLKDAQDAVDKASKASLDAAENLKQAAQNKGQELALSAESQKRVNEAKGQQDQVRRELDRLMEMLGQSQDTWAARRQIEKLLAEQQRVTQESRQAGKDTAGKSSQELSAQEAAELNRVAQEQRELAQRVQNSIDQMEAQAQATSKSSPAQSQAMKDAAQKGRQAQAADKQKKAADQLEKNQTQTANGLQQQAEQALADMLKSLEQSEKRRDEELRRILADVRDGLQKLVERQETELKSLGTAMLEQKGAGLDTGMISLHEATIAMREEIAGNKEVADVAVTVGDAADAQAAAVGSLRETPVAMAKADGSERTSLQKLKDALAQIDELRKKSEEKDLAQQREELKKAYEELLARQVEVKAAATPLVETSTGGKDLSRREKQVARELGAKQEAIRTDLYTLREKTEFLAEAKVFEFAHERLDSAGKAAGTILAGGSASAEVGRHESTMVRTLDALIEALKELKQKEDFRDGADGGGGGGGGGGSGGEKEKTIPPIAELRLLRMMQQEAFESTRAAAESADAAAVEAATKLQNELTKQAQGLIESTKEKGGGAKPPDMKVDPKKVEESEPKKAPEPAEPKGEKGSQ